jgi:hypothetical protein
VFDLIMRRRGIGESAVVSASFHIYGTVRVSFEQDIVIMNVTLDRMLLVKLTLAPNELSEISEGAHLVDNSGRLIAQKERPAIVRQFI